MLKLFCQIVVNLYLTLSYIQSTVAFEHKAQEIIFHIFKELPLDLKDTKKYIRRQNKKVKA